MKTTLTVIAFILPLIGYLRAMKQENVPAFILQPDKQLKLWLSDNTWASRFAVFFAIFLFAYNLVAWAIYGFISFFEFLAFLFIKLCWLIEWIWYEVLHPTVFALVKLLWHYLIIISWKLFQFSIQHVPASFKAKNIRLSFLKMLMLFGAGAVLLLISLFSESMAVTIVCSIILLFYFQYTLFTTVACMRNEKYSHKQVFPNLAITLSWFFSSAAASMILFLLYNTSDSYIPAALGVSLAQVLIPLALLTLIAFFAALYYLPAFNMKGDNVLKIVDFLVSLFKRLPKLIFAQGFQLIGIIIVGIVPLLIAGILSFGIQEVTNKSLPEWGGEVLTIGVHIPGIKQNNQEITRLNNESEYVSFKKDSTIAAIDTKINELRVFSYQDDDFSEKVQDLLNQKDDAVMQKDNKLYNLGVAIKVLEFENKNHVRKIIGKIITTLGLVLFISIFLTTIWTYIVSFHFDLYSFLQDGKHYWENLLSEIKAKNQNQPLLGIFALIPILIILLMIIGFVV